MNELRLGKLQLGVHVCYVAVNLCFHGQAGVYGVCDGRMCAILFQLALARVQCVHGEAMLIAATLTSDLFLSGRCQA